MNSNVIPICINCGKNPAQKLPPYGWMNCQSCQENQKHYQIPHQAIELSTPLILVGRKEYEKDILQSRRGNTVSLEYLKTYGAKQFTREEVKQAKNVWGEITYYSDATEKAVLK